MSLTLVTAPTAEPVSLADCKLHLRVDSTAENDLIAGLNTGARDYLESFTRRALPRQTWDWKLDAFPCGSEFYLPKAPCISVTSITYLDTDGAEQTLSTDVYGTDLPTGPMARAGRIYLKYNQQWPQTRDIPNAVVVRFVAGYAGTALTLASLTQSAGTATATVTAGHGLTDLQQVTIAGADQAGYNGTFTATYVSATVFTFAVAAGTVSPATGTVTVTPDPVPTMLKVCIKEHVRAMYGRGKEGTGKSFSMGAADILEWIHTQAWPYVSF